LNDIVSSQLYLGLGWRNFPENSYGHSTRTSLVAISPYLRALYLGTSGTFRLYFSFHWRDIPEISNLVFNTHSLQSA